MSVQAVLPVLPLQKAIAEIRSASAYESGLYISQRTLRASGMDPAAVSAAWHHMHMRHEALRASLVTASGRLVQVVRSTPTEIVYEHLDARGASAARGAVLLYDLRARHLARLENGGPAAALGLVSMPDSCTVVLSWRHELLDGTAVSVLLAELQTGLEVPDASIAAVLRALRGQSPIELGTQHLGRPPERLNAFDDDVSGAVVASERSLPYEAVERTARSLGVTVPTVATAACASALADLTGGGGFVLTAEDCRPDGFQGAVGMFTGTAATWRPSTASTFPEFAQRVQQQRASVAGRSPVPLTELVREAWSHGAGGFPDVLVTVHPRRTGVVLPSRWEPFDNLERTEFAISVDVVLDGESRLVVHRDASRVSSDEAAQLVRLIEANLAQHGSSTATRRPDRQLKTRSAHDSTVDLVLGVCRHVLARPDLSADDDLVAAGVDSLAMMRIAVALRDAGLAVSVSTLFSRRSVRGFAPSVRVAADAGESSSSTSAIERSLLRRSSRLHFGPAPMHEQSVIVVDQRLDAALFQLAVQYVANEVDGLRAIWSASSPDTLEFGLNVAVTPVDTSEDAMVAARAILSADLQRGFSPGDHLCRIWLVSDGKRTAIVMAWHNATLDGWSHATLLRFIQNAYQSAEAGRTMPANPGASISEFRSWCERGVDEREWWHDYLRGAVPVPVPSVVPMDERLSSDQVRVCSIAELAAWIDGRTSMALGAVTLIAHAAGLAFDLDQRSPVGVRLGLRPPSIRGVMRMIGQATVEAPIMIDPSAGAADCVAVSAAIAEARDRGSLGEIGIREAIGWSDEFDLYHVLIVPELELEADEWALRVGDSAAWPEVSTWRREVSPSRLTTYLHLNEDDLQVRVSASAGGSIELADKVADAAKRLLVAG